MFLFDLRTVNATVTQMNKKKDTSLRLQCLLRNIYLTVYAWKMKTIIGYQMLALKANVIKTSSKFMSHKKVFDPYLKL